MALASAAAANAALDGIAAVAGFASLHTASPGTDGSNENANSGGYARQAVAWNAASGGSMTNSGALSFTTGGTVEVTHVGTWSSGTYGAGTYYIGLALTSGLTAASITFAAGSLTLTAS
jgi:hypothetical protein